MGNSKQLWEIKILQKLYPCPCEYQKWCWCCHCAQGPHPVSASESTRADGLGDPILKPWLCSSQDAPPSCQQPHWKVHSKGSVNIYKDVHHNTAYTLRQYLNYPNLEFDILLTFCSCFTACRITSTTVVVLPVPGGPCMIATSFWVIAKDTASFWELSNPVLLNSKTSAIKET